MANELEGLQDCLKTLDNIGPQIMEEIDSILANAATKMFQKAVELVPSDTGALASSLQIKKSYRSEAAIGYVVEADTQYAICVEYGTENMEAQPYLRPSLDEVRGNLKLDLKSLQG